jgi:hypothetical protein
MGNTFVQKWFWLSRMVRFYIYVVGNGRRVTKRLGAKLARPLPR